jgi:uncharacterized membrane protein
VLIVVLTVLTAVLIVVLTVLTAVLTAVLIVVLVSARSARRGWGAARV